MKRLLQTFGVTALLAASAVAVAQAAKSAPAPKATSGATVQLFATGLKTPTAFAFGDGAVFEGDGGNSEKLPNGGLYVLKGGKGVNVNTPLIFVGGLVFHAGTLYAAGATLASAGPEFQIFALSGWNGTTFATQKPIYTAPKGFQGFNGLGIGADGRLYVGDDAGLLNNNDHGPATTSPDLYDILSMTTSGTGVTVFASGIRQPWQMAFPAGSSSPFVSDFGQDAGAKNPPDFLLRVKAGQNYGFPTCNFTKASACTGDATPFKEFAPHTDVGGVVIAGGKLYLSEFGFAGPKHPPLIVSLPLSGKGTPTTVVKGIPGGAIGLGANDGYLYIGVEGSKSGFVYRVKAGPRAGGG